MTRLTKEQLVALLERAKSATPGPWVDKWYEATLSKTLIEGPKPDQDFILAQTFGPHLGQAEQDAEFIAAANPDTIARLVTEVLELREALRKITNLVDPEGVIDAAEIATVALRGEP